MLLFELYQEESDSTVTHNNHEYDINKLLSLTEKFVPRKFKISDLDWIIKFSKPDPERLQEADPSIPIIVTYSDKKLVVVDGLHRLCKAKEQNMSHIDGKFVYKDVLGKCLIR